MTMTHDEMIEVIQAHKEGRTIQARHRKKHPWGDVPNPSWNFFEVQYRVKPEPKKLWVNFYGDIIYTHESKEAALSHAGGDRLTRTAVPFVEVTEND